MNNKLFDQWAKTYEEDVKKTQDNNEYPFAGYDDVLNEIVLRVSNMKATTILDIGIGSGTLAHKLSELNCEITGVDASSEMLAITKQKEGITMNRNDQQFLVQKIRTQYTEKEHTELDELKELDKKVKRPANVFAYVFGSASAIIMGSGMSLVMTDIGSSIGVKNGMAPGIIIGIIGSR